MVLPDFIEDGDYEKGFAEYYRSKIMPILGMVEDQRLVQLKKYTIRKMIGIPIMILVVIGALMLEGTGTGGGDFIKLGLFLCVLIWAGVYAPVLKYKQEIKSKFLPIVAGFFGDLKYELKPDPAGSASIAKMEVFPTYSTLEAEDYFGGSYKNVPLNMREMKLICGRGKNRTTVFAGLVIYLTFPKAFKGKTVLKRDAGFFNMFGKPNLGPNTEKIALEDPDFESIFETYGTDQIEARFLLTTAFMERLLNLAVIHGGAKEAKPSVQCEFADKSLVIMIPSRLNLFEPGNIKTTALKLADLHLFLKQMHEIFVLIDTLKLDRV